MPRSEVVYQAELIKRIESIFPGCFIIRNDPNDRQGIPDILILFNYGWAMLEVKLSERSPVRPNQEYYVNMFGEMSFASFIYPENEEQVLNDLQFAFGASR